MKSYKSVNLISIKVPDTQIYLKTTNRGFLNEYEKSLKVCVHDGQNRLSFQRQLFTADRSRNVVNDFCSRKMKSYKSVNLISIKVPDTQIYPKTTHRGFPNEYETSSKVCVHDGQNRLSFQRQLFTADRSRYVVNDFCSRQMKSYKSANLITVKVPDTKIYLKTTRRGFLNWYKTSSTVFST